MGAVLIFKRGHILARTLGLFDHKHFVGWCADTQRRLNILHRNRLVLVYDVANIIFFPFSTLYSQRQALVQVPLVRVALVDIAREQAATGVGHAQRAVNEDLDLHIRHLIADLFNLFQRQLARERITRVRPICCQNFTVAQFTALACTERCGSAFQGSAHAPA